MNFSEQTDSNAVVCLLKIGEVTDIDPATCRIRATFDDEDGKTSDWLPMLQIKTLEDKDYFMPDVGEDVLCLFFNEAEEEGFAIGSFYAGEVKPPTNSGDIRCVRFKDGTLISYDRSSHELLAEIGSTKILANRSNVTVEAPQTIENQAGQTAKLAAGSDVNISGGAAVNIETPILTLKTGSTKMVLSGGSASIETENLVFKGNMAVTGNLTVAGNIDGSGNISAGGRVSGTNI